MVVVGLLVAAAPADAQYRRYLAEGATGTFFATKLSLANPDAVNSASVVLTFDSGQGTTRTMPLSLAPGGTAFVDVGTVSGFESSDVSTTIESNRPIAVDRMMEWAVNPVTRRGYGSALETATPSASTSWFLAEGSTVLGFDLYYLLQNPQATIANVTVRYLLSSGTVITRTYGMAPHSRTTIYLNVIPGIEEIDVSGDISSNVPIIAERSMYRSGPGQYLRAGHELDGRHGPGDPMVPRRGRNRRLLRSLRPVRQSQQQRRQSQGRLRPRRRGRHHEELCGPRAQPLQRLRRRHPRAD